MRLPIAVLAASLALTAAIAAPVTRSFPATGFDKVLASGSEDVTITTGKAASVVATGPKERLDKLDIRVEGTTLKIGRERGSYSMSWRDDDSVRIAITMPALLGIHASGSGDITADRGSGAAFTGSSSGSGDLNIARIDSATPILRTSGSGNLTAAGQCTNGKFSTTGSGDLVLAGLGCTNVAVSTSGSGDVAVRATGAADIRITGSGDVTVTGGARCTSRTSGSGEPYCS